MFDPGQAAADESPTPGGPAESEPSVHPANGATPPARRRRDLSPRTVFWFGFGLLFSLTALWSVASPLMAGLDEPAHTIKAAAVVRGELVGERFVDPTAPLLVQAQQEGRGLVDVTALFAQLNTLPNCFAGKSQIPASCQEEVVVDADGAAETVTSASRYNPLYYAVVGVPSLLPGSPLTIYLMRAFSALIASLLLAMAFQTIAELRRSLWPALATAVAITPMVIFMNSTVNPQATELAGALTIWVTLLAALRHPDPALLRARLFRLSVATLFFVNARGLGPLFLAMIVVAVLVCSPWSNLVAVLRDRRSWPFLAFCTASTLAAVGWIVFVGSLVTSATVNFPEYADAETILKFTIDNTTDYIAQALGLFGWMDVPLPGWTYYSLAAVLLFVIFTGFAVARWRDRIVMLAIAALSLLLPLVAHYVQARYLGPFWQGRYILPIAFGVPILAGFALLDRLGGMPAWISRRLVGWGLAAVAGLQTFAFAVNLHRYVNGWAGSWFSTAADSWIPPLHPLLLVALTGVGWTALAFLLFTGSNQGYDATIPTRPAPGNSVAGRTQAIGVQAAGPLSRQPVPTLHAPGSSATP